MVQTKCVPANPGTHLVCTTGFRFFPIFIVQFIRFGGAYLRRGANPFPNGYDYANRAGAKYPHGDTPRPSTFSFWYGGDAGGGGNKRNMITNRMADCRSVTCIPPEAGDHLNIALRACRWGRSSGGCDKHP